MKTLLFPFRLDIRVTLAAAPPRPSSCPQLFLKLHLSRFNSHQAHGVSGQEDLSPALMLIETDGAVMFPVSPLNCLSQISEWHLFTSGDYQGPSSWQSLALSHDAAANPCLIPLRRFWTKRDVLDWIFAACVKLGCSAGDSRLQRLT